MPKLYLGPMSKNIVDGVIAYAEKRKIQIGLIASRRQIDECGGYVHNWTTRTFAEYVREKSSYVVLCRDHGGIGQGSYEDDGINSLIEDAKYFDIIHIDPWKKVNMVNPIDYTVNMIEKCVAVNDKCFFEIGTEESIRPITHIDLNVILETIKQRIPQLFHKILYAVIQAGTSLKDGCNTGEYDENRLITMCKVCLKHGLMSKEHNGDYQTPAQIHYKFNKGLSAINIAPEVANIESKILLNELKGSSTIDEWFNMCIKDGHWSKWFSNDFEPKSDYRRVLLLCGHYVFNTIPFDLNTIAGRVHYAVGEFINERLFQYGY